MNDLQRSLHRPEVLVPQRTLHSIVRKNGHLVTEGQIEQAGKAYVQASVWTAAAYAVIDGARLVGRTLWMLGTATALGFAGVWLYLHWGKVIRWLT